MRYDLTPQQGSLQGKGEKIDSPLLKGEGLGERSDCMALMWEQPYFISIPLGG